VDLSAISELGGLFPAFYVLFSGFCRLYLSPVASFPGPRLAALTSWFEFYYDVIKGGKYTLNIAELHRQYGSVIRINPFEVHINDPDFYDELHVSSSGRKTEAWSCTVLIPLF